MSKHEESVQNEGPTLEEVLTEVASTKEHQKSVALKAMEAYKATQKRLEALSRALSDLGVEVPEAVISAVRVKRAYHKRVKGEKIEKVSQGTGKGKGRRENSKSNMLVQLMTKVAPGKKAALSKGEIEAAAKAEGLELTSAQINTGLQANRSPKAKNPRIAMVPDAKGRTRGGHARYFAL